MREIKFRAWDKELKMMAYWYPENPHHWHTKQDQILYSFPKQDGPFLSDWMQYTGLKDKNGKEIFEGDIVEAIWDMTGTNEILKTIAEVKFSEGSFVWDDKKRHDSLFYKHITFNIIGNIWENPELVANARAGEVA